MVIDMKIEGFQNIYELSDDIILKYYDFDVDDEVTISVYGKYDIIKSLMEILISNGFLIDDMIELESEDSAGYNKEFVLSIDLRGINVCKMWHETNEYHDAGYLYSGGDICYIHGDCSSNLVSYIDGGKIIEFSVYDFGDDECCDEDCCCGCCGECDGSGCDMFEDSSSNSNEPEYVSDLVDFIFKHHIAYFADDDKGEQYFFVYHK